MDELNSIKIDAKYQVFNDINTLNYKESTLDVQLKPGEVLVELLISTICGSDLHTYSGYRKEDTPCILGHEGVGKVVAFYKRDGLSIGDRITWSIADSCGICKFCTEYMLPEKCTSLFKYGHASVYNETGLNGCYANYIILRKGTQIVQIPDNVSNRIAAPANCALATMVNAVSKVDPHSKNVVIQGGGLLGLYGIALLKTMGVNSVYCVEINPYRFKLIEKFGGILIDGRNPSTTSFIKANKQIDAVIEVAGSKKVIEQGVELLRPGGKYVFVGLVHPDSMLNITAETIIRKCLTVIGVHNYSPLHLKTAIEFLSEHINSFPFEYIVGSEFDLVHLKDAFLEAKESCWNRIAVKP